MGFFYEWFGNVNNEESVEKVENTPVEEGVSYQEPETVEGFLEQAKDDQSEEVVGRLGSEQKEDAKASAEASPNSRWKNQRIVCNEQEIVAALWQ